MDIMVDVLMPVYNHENYLKLAIEGIVNQKTEYKFRLLIGEDCSKDNSREIVKRYAEQHPDIIVPLLHEKNVGATRNSSALLDLTNAKYIAMCEGDDYWIDDTKLQRQVAFMEANPEFTMCFTDVEVLNETGTEQVHPYEILPKDVFYMEDFIMADKVFVPTVSLLFKNIVPKKYPDFYYRAISGDIVTHFLLADKGPAKRLPGKSAVYRQNLGGITRTKFAIDNVFIGKFKLYEDACEYFGEKYRMTFRKKLFEMSKVILVYGSRDKKGIDKVKYVFANASKYFKYQPGINIKEIIYYFCLVSFPWIFNRGRGKEMS